MTFMLWIWYHRSLRILALGMVVGAIMSWMVDPVIVSIGAVLAVCSTIGFVIQSWRMSRRLSR